MLRGSFIFLGAALLGASPLGAQEVKPDAETLRGRDRTALLDVRTILGAAKQYAARNGGLYGPMDCLTRPETCRADFPKDDPPFLDPTHDWLETRLGYVRKFLPGPAATEDEIRKSNAAPGSLRSFAFTAVPIKAGETGLRAFCGDVSGKICFTADGGAPGVRDGRCVAPCQEFK
jgi:hypothetical protein